ncbi:PLP-dependent aminotransferase family protein [Alkalimarinus coralli]|uniref:aminotransferase-like domain-containing protein n=1 Tax=Alkalimarinus coralli TaxID=2935863 RepID=UPI00202B64A4|nr:PLP-dependent aminotransferase family protein [Alkalimarinus coralli]
MSEWIPDLSNIQGPRYKALATAIGLAVEHGELKAEMRLPTHRSLAEALGVTVGTVTRGYTEAEERGYVYAVVGRGTFIKPEGEPGMLHIPEQHDSIIDLSLNLPVRLDKANDLAVAMQNVAKRPADLNKLLCYQPEVGLLEHRVVLAEWLSRPQWDVHADNVVITHGAQHGILVTLMALTRPGDVMLTEGLTYPGLTAITHQLKVDAQGLALDQEGIIPEALEAACQRYRPKLLYCTPTLQNPTTAIMSAQRRAEIIRICRQYEVLILEDDVNGPLAENAPLPMVAMAPEQVIYIGSLSKSLAAGLRIGAIVPPGCVLDRIAASVRASSWMVSPLVAEIACEWIRSGRAEQQIVHQREEVRRRQLVAKDKLAGFDVAIAPFGFHVWLKLPEPWRASQFVKEAEHRGVLLKGAGTFAVGRFEAPHAVRIAISSAIDIAQLSQGLDILVKMLKAGPEPTLSVF